MSREGVLTGFVFETVQALELELRAHSILLEALEQKVITPDEIPGFLDIARQSPAMRGFVAEKYTRLMEDLMRESRAGQRFPEQRVEQVVLKQ